MSGDLTTWAAVLGAAALCFALKVAGWLVPPRALASARVRRTAVLLPVALLAGLVVVQVLAQETGEGPALGLDARAAGLAAGAVALLLRAPFLLVVAVAAATAALLRAG